MGKIILTAVLFLALLTSVRYGLAKEATAVLRVSGMTCSACPITIRHRIMKLKGVHKAVVERSSATATVTFEDSVQSAAAIAGAITKLGYPTTLEEEAK